MTAREIRVDGIVPVDLIKLNQLMQEHGMVLHKDYDFAYHPPKNGVFEEQQASFTVFTFYNDECATWFALKYL